MPHLDSGSFVHDRMRSIVEQTFTDWELVVVDSASTDGSLEVIEEFASRDARIRVHQAPRDGIYTNINRAIEMARGEFVYLATSDDTMSPTCLEEMVAGLDAHPECGMAHCRLSIIDGTGKPLIGEGAWENYASQRFFGAWLDRRHVRRAPHDGLLHFRHFTVYTSLTQLLFRRELFARFGLFRTDRRSFADFEWEMKASLLEDVLHVPTALATWRRHDAQATRGNRLLEARADGLFVRMARDVCRWLEDERPALARRVRERRMIRFYLYDQLEAGLASAGKDGRVRALVRFFAREPVFGFSLFVRRVLRMVGMRREATIGDEIVVLMSRPGLDEV
jgi:glycosyltransferase involved in cell wall biosynthesis